MGLEAAASRLRKYEAQLIPGLLQTKAYATHVYEVARPDMTVDEIDRGVAVRLGRQALLTRSTPAAPQVDILLDEAVLRRGVDIEQLDHIASVSRQPNISVRVVPFTIGLHRAAMANGAFTILDFDRGDEPSIIYSDGLTGALYLDKPAEVAAYEDVWSAIEMKALSEADSREVIASIAEEQK